MKNSKNEAKKGEGIKHNSKADKDNAEEIYTILADTYKSPKVALDYTNVFEFLVATVLSAQTTDKQVNKITPALFKKYKDAEALAAANLEDVEKLVYSTGFYKAKAKRIIALAQHLVEEHDGKIPQTMKELLKVPGVGRKTANVILGNFYGVPGVVVDTHVTRLANIFGWANSKNAEIIEKDLENLFDESKWVNLSNILIYHGREICNAKAPLCLDCPVNHLCKSFLEGLIIPKEKNK